MTQFQTHILIVEDEPAVSDLLRQTFQDAGFGVSLARNGTELRERLRAEPIGLITLDITLPGEDGIELARQVRREHDVPIIIISGTSKKITKVVSLEVGADDYIVKPFDLDELVARVRAILRRSRRASVGDFSTEPRTASAGDVVEFENWRFDQAGHRLWSPSGELVDLTANEVQLLAIFVRNPRVPLTRMEIANRLRGGEDTSSERSIDVVVGRLRRKLEKSDVSTELIKTVRGEGYLFCPEVRPAARSSRP